MRDEGDISVEDRSTTLARWRYSRCAGGVQQGIARHAASVNVPHGNCKLVFDIICVVQIRVATLHASCTLHIYRFGRVHRFSNFVPSSAHGSRSGHELGTDDVGAHAEFKSVFQSAYALLHEVGKTSGPLVQRRTLVPTMGCNGFVMVSGQAALRTSTPLVPHVIETTKERAMVHL